MDVASDDPQDEALSCRRRVWGRFPKLFGKKVTKKVTENIIKSDLKVSMHAPVSPQFDAWGSGKQCEAQRHVFVRQVRICLNMSYTCRRPHKPFGLRSGQLTREKGGTDSCKEGSLQCHSNICITSTTRRY